MVRPAHLWTITVSKSDDLARDQTRGAWISACLSAFGAYCLIDRLQRTQIQHVHARTGNRDRIRRLVRHRGTVVDFQALTERAAHYEALARATYDIAEQCDDVAMMHAYLMLAGRWLLMAEEALDQAERLRH